LKLMKRSGGDISQNLSALQRRLQGLDDDLSEKLPAGPAHAAAKPEALAVGDTVEIPHLNAVGTVLSLPDTKGEVMIQAGIIKMKVLAAQVRLTRQPVQKKTSVRTKTGAAERSVKMECDVRGLALDEALMEVDRYLDMAVMAGLHEVSIIHGKGTGTLRAGIQQHLKNTRQVKSYRLGLYGEGESGVTVVELK